ncbi:hypothetical protein AM1_5332 [Acaryochloris marina MBIC11017]|uniref:Uncharacterized protein n=1 Tax=Acaryochloris marina (strain MBIC 11017) TaxID=329726 RepID=B0CAT9_ACAM1|nr:hypothetical protein AM1_5332 [Acaryochloris marina MBIC11017]
MLIEAINPLLLLATKNFLIFQYNLPPRTYDSAAGQLRILME